MPTRSHRASRQLRQWFAVAAVVAAFPAAALQMGAAQLESFLAQPLLVRIPIVVDEGGAVPDAAKFRARVLPADAYVRQGLEPPGFSVDDLSARVSEGGQGRYWLIVKSGRSFGEPAATLLIQLSDGRQTIIRQVDLLLDPEPADWVPPQMAEAEATLAEERPQRARTAPPAGEGARSYGPVRRGETLVEIAQRVRPDPTTDLERMADALREANPALADVAMDEQAPVGAILRVPSLVAVAATPRPQVMEANAPVVRQAAPAPIVRDAQPRVAPPPPTLPPVSGSQAHTEPLALETEFKSYSDRDRAGKTLEELDRQEPGRYRADWTLDSLREREMDNGEPAVAAADEGAATDVDVDENPLDALEQLRSFIDETEPDDALGADEAAPGDDSAADAEEIIIAEPLAVDQDAEIGGEAVASTDGSNWLVTLMLIFGGVAAWAAWPRFGPQLLDQWRARQVPQTPDVEAEAAADEPDQDVGLGAESPVPARLNQLLTQARESSDAEVVRQATVAEVMVMRGHYDDAERVLSMALLGGGAEAPEGEDAPNTASAPAPNLEEDTDTDAAFGATVAFDEPPEAPSAAEAQFDQTVEMDTTLDAEAEDRRVDIEQELFDLVSEELPVSDDMALDFALNGDDEEEEPLELEPTLDDDAPLELEMSAPYEDVQAADTHESEPVELDLDLAGLELDEPVDSAVEGLQLADDEAEPATPIADDVAEPDPQALRDMLQELKKEARHDEQLQKLREAEAMIDDGQLGAAARLLDFLRGS